MIRRGRHVEEEETVQEDKEEEREGRIKIVIQLNVISVTNWGTTSTNSLPGISRQITQRLKKQRSYC